MITNKNSPIKIFVVDDEPIILYITQGLLQKEQYFVSIADSGQDCFDVIHRHGWWHCYGLKERFKKEPRYISNFSGVLKHMID